SSSGKGQSTAKSKDDVGAAWDYAGAKMRGDRPRGIGEESVEFSSELHAALPIVSRSGKSESTAKSKNDVGAAWDYAVANMRGDRPRVIVEEFVEFDSEITLLTIATQAGALSCAPIGHRQEAGDYRESWQPAGIPD